MTKQKSCFTQFGSKTKNYLLKFFLAQLIVTLISLPILISWGLPISLASPIGNLFFSPIIAVFLIISSFLFFTELLGLPNFYLALLLNKITNILEYCLNWGQKSWLIGFQSSTRLILIVIPLLIMLLIVHKLKKTSIKIIILTLTVCTSFCCLKYVTPPAKEMSSYLPNTKNKLQLTVHKDNTISLYDSGCFSQKQSIENFINFEVTPFLIKKFGNTTIKNLILLRPGIRSFKAAMELYKIFKINCIKINFNSIKPNKSTWKQLYNLKKVLIKNDTQLIIFKKN